MGRGQLLMQPLLSDAAAWLIVGSSVDVDREGVGCVTLCNYTLLHVSQQSNHGDQV
jgi:hypothetical protein